jgi:hypothetical protein
MLPALTTKQAYIMKLIRKANKTTFSTTTLFETQYKQNALSRKAITFHLMNLVKLQQITRTKRGQYMLTETIKNSMKNITKTNKGGAKSLKNSTVSIEPNKTVDLPTFLAHEDIDKLLSWKTESIQETTQTIENLNLKITKLKKQKETLTNIKTQFC